MDDENASASEPASSASAGDHPPPRLCSYKISFREGFLSQEQAQSLADRVQGIALPFSRYFPLERLDGVTFAEDYTAALRELDRGFGASKVLAATAEEFATGVAMSPMVQRDGVVKTHIVFSSLVAGMLMSDEAEHFERAMNAVAHEFGHASYNQLCDEAVPGMFLKPPADEYEGKIHYHCGDCPDEYVATIRSSFIGSNILQGYRDTLISICDQAHSALVSARATYRSDGDYSALSYSTFAAIGKIMKFSGYVLGQADGEEENPFDADGKLEEALNRLDLKEWFKELHSLLRGFHDRLQTLSSAEDFYVFNRLAEEGARIHGVHSRRSENGQQWVDIETRVYWMDG